MRDLIASRQGSGSSKTGCTLVLHLGPTCTIDRLAARTDTSSTERTQTSDTVPSRPSRQYSSLAHVRHTRNKGILERQRPKDDNDLGQADRALGADHLAGCRIVPCRWQ